MPRCCAMSATMVASFVTSCSGGSGRKRPSCGRGGLEYQVAPDFKPASSRSNITASASVVVARRAGVARRSIREKGMISTNAVALAASLALATSAFAQGAGGGSGGDGGGGGGGAGGGGGG